MFVLAPWLVVVLKFSSSANIGVFLVLVVPGGPCILLWRFPVVWFLFPRALWTWWDHYVVCVLQVVLVSPHSFVFAVGQRGEMVPDPSTIQTCSSSRSEPFCGPPAPSHAAISDDAPGASQAPSRAIV